MTQLINDFQPICKEVQRKLQDALRGLTGMFIKGYLPQAWVFKTEKETITFHVDKSGKATVKEGDTPSPDVIITVDHDYLHEALSTRKQPAFAYKTLDVKFRTQKGKTAFNYIRGQLGL